MTDPITTTLAALRINRDSPVPMYHQIEEGLTRLIESGALAPGQLLPSETELSQALRISPMTARQALNALAARGMIRRQRGVGSFVLARRFDRPLDHPVGFTEDMLARGVTPGARILRFEPSTAPTEAVERGILAEGTPMLRIKRLRLANDQPVALQDAYFSGVSFTREELEAAGSVYRLLADRGITLRKAQETIDAVAASRDEANLLGIPENGPLLRTLLFSVDGIDGFQEFTIAVYRSDLYQFRAVLQRW
jgi:GntR family transcriptional regulator